MANRSQLAIIHLAQKQLNISRSNYEGMLSGWINTKTGNPIEHSNELTHEQAEEVIKAFEELGFVRKKSTKKELPIKITVPENRPEEFASQAQINMLAGMWVQHSREKTQKSLEKFILRLAEINKVEWLQKDQVQKIKKAIEELK